MPRKIFFLFLLLINFSPFFPIGRKVVWESLEWYILKGENFWIYYPKGYEKLAKIALLYAEEANILLSKKLAYNLSQVIPIFIYPSHIYFQMTNIIDGVIDEGVGGFTEPLKRRVVLPFMGSYDSFRHVLTHELVHAYQYDILLGTGLGTPILQFYVSFPPLWFIEGMAEYFSIGWDYKAEEVIRDAILSETLPSIDDMSSFRIKTGYMIYKGGQSVLYFIAQEWGEEKIGEILKDTRDQKDFRAAIKTNLGISIEELNEKWRLFFQRRASLYTQGKTGKEWGKMITSEKEDGTFFNLYPTISPDGKYIAYISIRGFLPTLVLRKLPPYQKEPNYQIKEESFDYEEEILLHAGCEEEFYRIHLLDNRLSFSKDGKKLLLAVQSYGRDHLYLIEIPSGEVLKKIPLPLDAISSPYLHPSGKKAVFIGVIAGEVDLFLIDLETRELTRLTHDLFAEKDPIFSPDGEYILFVSNRNPEGNWESRDYNIFELHIATGKITPILQKEGVERFPSYYHKREQKRILYLSNHNGVYNLYLYDREEEKSYPFTHMRGSILSYSMDKEQEILAFLIYEKQSYQIGIRKYPSSPDEIANQVPDNFQEEKVSYPLYPGNLSRAKRDPYTLQMSPDILFAGAQYSSLAGFGGFGFGSFSDYLGNHRILSYIEYFSSLNIFNFNLSYAYLGKRLQFYTGIYRFSAFFNIISLVAIRSVNDLLYNPFFLTSSLERFGVFSAGVYPLNSFWHIGVSVEMSRYEETFFQKVPPNYRRKDIFTNIASTTWFLFHDNVLYSIWGPLRGFFFAFQFEHNFPLSREDALYDRYLMEFRIYQTFFRRYTLAYRIFLGAVVGPSGELFPWQIGGYNTIRGYPFFFFKGKYASFFNLEFRFPLIEGILIGFPVPWILQGFSGVLFLDGGFAVDNLSSYRGYEGGRLKDFVLSYGVGIRFLLYPGLFIQVDWATPWDLKTSLPPKRWRGTFSIGYPF